MAGRIAGITIEIGGDTTKLQTALKGVDSQLRTTQNNLKDINRLLKLDPGNTELLTQKQKNLEKAIATTKDRLEQLKDAQSQTTKGSAEWDALQREIIATEQNLKSLEKEYKNFGSVTAQEIANAGRQMQEFGSKVEQVGQKLAPISAAAAGLVTGMVGLGYSSVVAADDLNTLAKQTGISTEELQKMQYASDLIDVSFDTFTGSIAKMVGRLRTNEEAFADLGVATRGVGGEMLSTDEIFRNSITALSQIENETERDIAAQELFGKSAAELAGLIDDGGAAFDEYGQEAEELGLILSQDTLDSINQTNDAIDRSKAQLKLAAAELGATVATGLAPAIEKISGGVQKLVTWLQRLTPEQTNTILKIAGIVAAIAPLLIIGGKLITGIGMLLTFAPLITLAFSPVTLTILAIVAGIAVLVAAGVALIKHWDEVKAFFVETWEKIRDKWEEFKTKLVESFTTFGENAKESFRETWENMKTAAADAWENIKSTISKKAGNIRSNISEKFENAKEKVQSVIDKITGIINGTQWRLPHLALPHLSVWGQLSISPPSVPHFSIEWYKKAYENPVMFTSPTVLQTPQGLKGFGDGNGGEVVMGLNKLKELVGSAGDSVQNNTINVYASDGMNINQLADAIQARLVQLSRQKEAARA